MGSIVGGSLLILLGIGLAASSRLWWLYIVAYNQRVRAQFPWRRGRSAPVSRRVDAITRWFGSAFLGFGAVCFVAVGCVVLSQ
jgi:uncharacterized membrane protein